jgi:hypothetical protein
MKNKFLSSPPSTEPPTSDPTDQPTMKAPRKKWLRKKIYLIIAAVVIIAVILGASFLIPQSNANVVPLGVHYVTGEKLTYDVTSSASAVSQAQNISTNVSSKGILTVEVISFDGQIYTLNYTTTSSTGDLKTVISRVINVRESDMITFFGLLPITLQPLITTSNDSSPILSAPFNQSEAKVGDTWNITLNMTDSTSTRIGELTVTFKAIQNLSVKAGTYKVFRIDFTQNTQQNTEFGNPLYYNNLNFDFSCQSYLEYGSCKQIQSTFQLNMTSQLGTASSYSLFDSVTSTLTQDIVS